MLGKNPRRFQWLATLATGATLFQLGGCDPTLRATLEDGAINVSTSLLTSVLQAVVQVFDNVYGTGA